MEKKLTFRSTLSRVGLCYFTLMLVTQLLQTVLSLLMMEQIQSGGWWMWIISYVPLYLIAVPIFCLMMKKLVPDMRDTFGTAALSFKGWVRWFFMCLGITYIGNFVSIGILSLIAMLKGGEVMNPLASVVDASNPVATVLFGAVIAPVGEEFLFRKLLHDKIGRYGVRTYMLVGAFIFAMFHANLSQFLYAFVLGAIFCYIYAYTGKLICTIALHISINFVGTFLMPLLAVLGEVGVMIVGLLVMVLIVTAIVLAVRKRWRFNPQTAPQIVEEVSVEESAQTEEMQPEEESGRAKRQKKDVPHTFGGALRTPGMIAYTVLCLLLIALVTLS